jgi:chromosome segregation ATPase
VSRLLAAQERDLGKLRLELEEAQTTAERVERKFRTDRERVERLEDELGKARSEFERVKQQRDAARADAQRAREAHAQMSARIDQLEANLALARTMLDDAMGEGPLEPKFTSARPQVSGPPRIKPEVARESGIRRPQRDIDESYPPGLVPSREARRADTPRPLAAIGRSRSRPPT